MRCRLGLDGNPLRRRTDRVATWLAAQFLVVVLIGVPLAGIATFTWADRAGAAQLRAQRSWREVPAVLLRSVPVPDSFAGGVFGVFFSRKEFQETEIIIAPSIKSEGKLFQTVQGVGMGTR